MEQRNNLVLQGTETFSRGQLDNVALDGGAPAVQDTAECDDAHFTHPLPIGERAILFGAGHCSVALCPLLTTVGFRVTVVDNRPELATRERFPTADAVLCCDLAHISDAVTIGDDDYTATVVGEDSTSDIAVIKVDADGLTPAIVGDSDKLAVGDNVLAVGNPLGELGGTVTGGMISALNRSVTIQGSSSVNTMSLIQMDASVSPGNSGGGLFNMNGELVGIVNAKSSDSDAEGLGFAIPINDAIKVAQDLLENGYVSGRPYMGITYLAVNDAQTAAQLGVNAYGIYVVDVVSGGPADKAGLKAGDRIVSIDNTEVAQKTDLGTLMQEHSAGDTLSITVARDGQMQTVSLTLGEKNASNSGNGTNGASRQEKSAESAPQQNPQG